MYGDNTDIFCNLAVNIDIDMVLNKILKELA